MYMLSKFDGKYMYKEIDQFETSLQSSQDSIPITLTGQNPTANLILMYSFSENEYSRETLLSSSSSAGI